MHNQYYFCDGYKIGCYTYCDGHVDCTDIADETECQTFTRYKRPVPTPPPMIWPTPTARVVFVMAEGLLMKVLTVSVVFGCAMLVLGVAFSGLNMIKTWRQRSAKPEPEHLIL